MDRDPAEETLDVDALARAQRTRRAIGIAVVLLLLAAPFIWFYLKLDAHEERMEERRGAAALTSEERAQLEEMLDRAQEQQRQASERWGQAITGARLATFEPGEGPCTANLQAPTASAAESYLEHGSIDGVYFGSWGYRLIDLTMPLDPPSALSAAAATIAKVRSELASGGGREQDLRAIDRILSGRAWRGSVVFIVAEEQRDPVYLASAEVLGSFDSGYVRGRAYAVDLAMQSVICVGEVEVGNSPMLDFSYLSTSPLDTLSKRAAAEATLARDLEINLRRAIAEGLRAPGPGSS